MTPSGGHKPARASPLKRSYSPIFFLLPLRVFPQAVRVLLRLAVLGPEAVRAVARPAAASGAAAAVAEAPVVSEAAVPGPVAGVVGPRASVDTVVASAASMPVAAGLVEVGNPELPRFSAFANTRYRASLSSSFEAGRYRSSDNSMGFRASYGFCSNLSSPGRHPNRSREHD